MLLEAEINHKSWCHLALVAQGLTHLFTIEKECKAENISTSEPPPYTHSKPPVPQQPGMYPVYDLKGGTLEIAPADPVPPKAQTVTSSPYRQCLDALSSMNTDELTALDPSCFNKTPPSVSLEPEPSLGNLDKQKGQPLDPRYFSHPPSVGREGPPSSGPPSFSGYPDRQESQTLSVTPTPSLPQSLPGWNNRPILHPLREHPHVTQTPMCYSRDPPGLDGPIRITSEVLAVPLEPAGRRYKLEPQEHDDPDSPVPRSDSTTGAYPLLIDRGRVKYRPFALGDIQALVDRLPPLTEGGSKWLSAVDSFSKGTTLAVGDMRALLARCVTSTKMCELEVAAGWGPHVPDSEPMTRQIAALAVALREAYPLPEGAGVPKFQWKPGQNPTTYLDQCKQDWHDRTHCHGQAKEQRHFFRQAILDGVPDTVTEAMKANPDLPSAGAEMWERHLIHFLQKAANEANKTKADLEDMQAQLLKLQLKQARDVVNPRKDKKQMVTAAVALPETPPTQPTPAPPATFVQPQWPARSQWRSRGGPRGRGYRRGYMQGPRTQDLCYVCGKPGHWAKNCYQRQGQGPPQGGPSHQAPHPQMAPPGQYPTMDGDWTQWHGPEGPFQQ